MFSKILTAKSTGDFSDNIKRLKNEIATSDAIVIGAGAGLSASAGFDYSGERFYKYFSDFHKKYGITDMYSGGFYPYETPREYWAWWSRHILVNRYDCPVGKPYSDLLKLVKDKDYFVLTTNVDHQFQRAGFDKNRLFYTQGDYGLWQCSRPCHGKTYDNEEAVRRMVAEQTDMKIPAALIPKCPVCGAPMTMNLRCDSSFVQDEGWYAAANRYEDFIRRHSNLHILFLELGVGMNTPVIIKYPFLEMTAQNPNAVYACVNQGRAFCPPELRSQSVCINADISALLSACL
ncbi:MAG: Sir2 silent information regulator family NAD-dependent deacetylase [Firmicutes bacterium]|nr:Sir2 silent information regulator family NAD-dependent deacetylase [Bacillota bacterium]